jgi:hypothetical protein
MTSNNLSISPPYTTWPWTFYFAPSNHPLARMGKHFSPLFNYFLFSNQYNFLKTSTLVFFRISEIFTHFSNFLEPLNNHNCCYAKVLKEHPKMKHQLSKHSQI